jgi:YD repeat-containing protein
MAMTMDSIVYPTGGTSKLVYEPHQSNMISGQSVTGGGIRVKTMKNYANGNLIGTKEYSYTNGKYMGAIRYFTKENMMSYCNGDNPSSIVHWKYSANGAVNADEILIGYGTITIKETDINGVSNGSLVKAFNINTSSSNYSNGGLGFDLQAPYFVPSETQATVQGFTFETWLDAQNKNFPPTPSSNLEGKLMQEKYLDNSNNCLKSVNYYYSLGNYSNNFYDVKAIQNRVGGFSGSCGVNSPNNGYNSGGWRPVNLFVTPAKSFFTLTDSIKEITYQGIDSLVVKKSFTYDSKYQVRSESVYTSDNSVKTTSYTRPYDYLQTGVNGSTTIVYEMVGRNMNSTLYSTTNRKNGNLIDSIFNLYYIASSGVDVPQNTQIQIANNPIEVRQNYNYYDSYGHLLERQKPGGVKEVYLWGYDSHYPVAYVVGSDYATVSGKINSGIVSSSILNNPPSDAVLRLELNKFRTQLNGALVKTYTYDMILGMTSETDPGGRTSFYEYDGMGRLAVIRDQDNNVLKRFCYNYAGQPGACEYFYNDIQSGTFVRNNCGAGFTGTAAIYTIPANTYSSAVSKADANAQAIADINENGQNYANSNGGCVTSCSFSMMSGYSSPTNSISNDGTNGYFYITFTSNSKMSLNNYYTVAQINGGCKPSNSTVIPFSTLGRTFKITISSGGYMTWQLTSGSDLPANTAISTTSLSYPLL